MLRVFFMSSVISWGCLPSLKWGPPPTHLQSKDFCLLVIEEFYAEICLLIIMVEFRAWSSCPKSCSRFWLTSFSRLRPRLSSYESCWAWSLWAWSGNPEPDPVAWSRSLEPGPGFIFHKYCSRLPIWLRSYICKRVLTETIISFVQVFKTQVLNA